jgi:UDPglucose 6-dehydrogenase
MTVIGCGHLGATHAACMASIGHEVVGVDIDDSKISLLNSGKAWFHEPGLDEMLSENIKAGRLRFTTSFAEAAEFSSVHFVGVATPGHDDGSYDLSQLHAVISSLAPHLRGASVLIGKSTVPPGTAAALQAQADGLLLPDLSAGLEVVWNPEFLREGCAVEDTLRPDRIVAGVVSAGAAKIVKEIYQPLTDAGVPLVITDLPTSELAKGAANAFLATKISFINAMADICAITDADVSALARSLGMDPRIGSAFLKAGLGYGGACLPKDVRGLGTFASEKGARNAANLLAAVDGVNSSRGGQVVDLVRAAVGDASGRRIAMWGAAFKSGTDDVRDSVALSVANELHRLGAEVTVYDPMASSNALVASPELRYANSAEAALRDADVLVVVTAWPEFEQASPVKVGEAVTRKTVIDACQGIDVAAWQAAGWRVSSLTGVRAGRSLMDPTSAVA